jgi:hypothetical protein
MITPPAHDPYNQTQPSNYPGGMNFPPPPNAAINEPAYHNAQPDPYAAQRDAQNYNPYPAYNPATFPAGATHQPYEQSRGAYGESDATLGAPYPGGETFAGDSRYPTPEDAAVQREREHEHREDAQEARRGRDPGNVSGSSSIPMPVPEQAQHGYESQGGVGGGGGDVDQDAGTSLRRRTRS